MRKVIERREIERSLSSFFVPPEIWTHAPPSAGAAAPDGGVAPKPLARRCPCPPACAARTWRATPSKPPKRALRARWGAAPPSSPCLLLPSIPLPTRPMGWGSCQDQRVRGAHLPGPPYRHAIETRHAHPQLKHLSPLLPLSTRALQAISTDEPDVLFLFSFIR